MNAGLLGLYLHVPFCKHVCPYCDFYKLELRDRPARSRLEFPELLAREHGLLLEEHPELRGRALESIYLGGGTPSTLSPATVGRLVESLRGAHGGGDVEVTLEANPENLTAGRCEAWRAAGITRLSIGVQSFHGRDLERLERLHTPDLIPRVVANARAAGFDNVSLDLMFGLPGQSCGEWMENLERALELEPEHVSFYGLTLHEGTVFFDEARGGGLGNLPGEDAQAEMYLGGREVLERAGFEHYEISNFARAGRRSRHNQRYWRGDDVVGLGPGAHSNLGDGRWCNPDDLDGWEAALRGGRLGRRATEILDNGAAMEELLFRRLRRCEGFAAGGDGLERRVWAWFESAEGAEMLARGWFVRDLERVRPTGAGWLVSDAVLGRLVAACGVGSMSKVRSFQGSKS